MALAKALPGAAFGAERYLEADRGRAGFKGALASKYTKLGRHAAFRDQRLRNATAYIGARRSGVDGDAAAIYQHISGRGRQGSPA